MLEKLKDKFKSGETPEGEVSGEKAEPKPLSGAPKIAVAGLGIFIMVVGVGFFLMQMMGGGGSSRQQMMAQAQKAEQDQTSRKLQALMDKAPKTERSGQDAAQGQKEAEARSEKPEPTDTAPQAADDLKKKALKKPSADRGQMPAPQASAAPAAGRANSKPARGAPVQPEPASGKLASSQMEKIMDRLAAIEKSINAGIDQMSSTVTELKHGIAANGDRVAALSDRVDGGSGGSNMDPEKYARLITQKQDLKKRVSGLKGQVEELEGKYKWVRHLEGQKRKKLEQARQELELAQNELEELRQRPVFGEWQLAGLSSEEILLANPYNGEVKRLQLGQTFKGVTIEKIDAAKGTVRTNAGTLELG